MEVPSGAGAEAERGPAAARGARDRSVAAANLFGPPLYIAEQQGFRKVLDTSFIIGFLVTNDADMDDVARYFRALQRAQQDIDLEPEKYRHYFLREIPPKYHDLIEVRLFGIGERIVSEPYTREMFELLFPQRADWSMLRAGESR